MQTVTVQKDGVGTLVPPIKGKGDCEHRGMVPVTSVWAAHLTLSVSGCGVGTVENWPATTSLE